MPIAMPDTISQPFSTQRRGRASLFWGLAVIIHQSGGGGLRFCNADRRRKERNSRLGRGVEECLGHAKNCSLSDRQLVVQKSGVIASCKIGRRHATLRVTNRECESILLHEVEIGKMIFSYCDNDQRSSLRLWTHVHFQE